MYAYVHRLVLSSSIRTIELKSLRRLLHHSGTSLGVWVAVLQGALKSKFWNTQTANGVNGIPVTGFSLLGQVADGCCCCCWPPEQNTSEWVHMIFWDSCCILSNPFTVPYWLSFRIVTLLSFLLFPLSCAPYFW
jgi:hypothetical protein